MIPDQSVTLIYKFDAMMHFDKLVVRDYVAEFRRILKPGGCAFIHHSNLGALHPDSDWARNTGSRSDMSAELTRQHAADSKLAVRFQRLSGMADGWGMDNLDCFTVLERPR
ncbi:class I SAM-dependent methyltransferase [Cupriavidus basilensis]